MRLSGSAPRAMFLKLFFALKAARVPVSLREHLTLIEAMDAGLARYDVD